MRAKTLNAAATQTALAPRCTMLGDGYTLGIARCLEGYACLAIQRGSDSQGRAAVRRGCHPARDNFGSALSVRSRHACAV